MASMTVGIDLGTTTTVVASLTDHTGFREPRVLADPNLASNSFTDSVVFFDPDSPEAVVGSSALSSFVDNPQQTVMEVKRFIGTARRFPEANPSKLAHEVLAEILAYRLAALPPEAATVHADQIRVVVSVPAYYGDLERRRTEAAWELARKRTEDNNKGLRFELEGLIDEPLAAAICHSTETSDVFKDRPLLVLDLGGGTFDLTAYQARTLRNTGELSINVLANEGEQQLGGADWDEVIMKWWLAKAQQTIPPGEKQSAEEERELKLECKDKRQALTQSPRTSIAGTIGGQRLKFPLTRDELGALSAGLLGRIDKVIDRVTTRLRDTHGLDESALLVLLVGGGTVMHMVKQHIVARFGMESVVVCRAPQEAVALGACLYCAIRQGVRFSNPALQHIQRIVVRPILTRSYGVVGPLETGQFGMSVVVPRNSLCDESEYVYDDVQVRNNTSAPIELRFGAIDRVAAKGDFIPLGQGGANYAEQKILLTLPPGRTAVAGQKIRILLRPSANGRILGRAELMDHANPLVRVCDVQFDLRY